MENGGLRLEKPEISHKQRYERMMDEWEAYGGKIHPGALRRFSKSRNITVTYEEWLGWIAGDRAAGQELYFLVRGETLLGAVSLRPRKDAEHVGVDGHIGFGIRPSERRKGYAARLLGMALPAIRSLGVGTVIVTCNKDNIGSAKTILKNGGVFEREILEENGNTVLRYRFEP